MVALASPNRRSAPDVQESELSEVCFYAHQISNGRVFVQIRKKQSKDQFAVWVTGGGDSKVTDEKISRKELEIALETGKICSSVTIEITPSNSARIKRILSVR